VLSGIHPSAPGSPPSRLTSLGRVRTGKLADTERGNIGAAQVLTLPSGQQADVLIPIKVNSMIEATVVEMAFVPSKVAGSWSTPAANAAGHMATTPVAAHMPYETWKAKFQKGPAKPHKHAG
jgi:hypothetical protein